MQIKFTQQLIISTFCLLSNCVIASTRNFSLEIVAQGNLTYRLSKTQIHFTEQINTFSEAVSTKDKNKETFYNSINDDG